MAKRIAIETAVSARCVFDVPDGFSFTAADINDPILQKITDIMDSWIKDNLAEVSAVGWSEEMPLEEYEDSADYDLTQEEVD